MFLLNRFFEYITSTLEARKKAYNAKYCKEYRDYCKCNRVHKKGFQKGYYW